MINKPSKADVLRVAGEPIAEVIMFNGFKDIRYKVKDVEVGDFLYTESQLLAMYAAGIESAKADGWRQCAVGQHTSQFCGQLEVEKAKAYAKGAEGMRERAMETVKNWKRENLLPICCDHSQHIALVECEQAISALPITPTNEGEQG